MSRLVRIGMIGAGYVSHSHSECILSSGRGSLEIIADISGERAKALADYFGFKSWTTNWKEVIDSPEVDVVDINVPNYLHKEICIATAEAHKDFIIEKPLCLSVKEADDIINIVKKYGVKAYYAEDLRYAPALVEARNIEDQGGIGKPFMMWLSEMHGGPFHSKWFWDGKLSGGGALIDEGIHGLYVIEWLMNSKVVEVFAKIGCMKWGKFCKNNVEDTAWAIWTFENGEVAQTIFSWAIADRMEGRIEIFGTEGSIFIDTDRGAAGLVVYSEKGYGENIKTLRAARPHVPGVKGWHFPMVDEWNIQGHNQEIKHFLGCWLDGKEPYTKLEDGRRALELVEAAYKSASTGKVEKV